LDPKECNKLFKSHGAFIGHDGPNHSDFDEVEKERVAMETNNRNNQRQVNIYCVSAPDSSRVHLLDNTEKEQFFTDVSNNKVCYLVQGLPTQDPLEQGTLFPFPLSAKIDKDLVNYKAGDQSMEINLAGIKESKQLAVTMFPRQTASLQVAVALHENFALFMEKRGSLLESCDKNLEGVAYCTDHFMEYGGKLRQEILGAHCDSQVWEPKFISDGVIGFEFADFGDPDPGCMMATIFFLSAQPEVTYIEISERVSLISNKDASWVLQSGESLSFPFYEIGINGTGQVIGISDTGIDDRSCYFSDPSGATVQRSTVPGNLHSDSSLRKVTMVIDYAGDGGDCVSGHGTHVAGTIAGIPSSAGIGDDRAYGVARGAKIAMMDVAVGCSGFLTLPSNYITGFLQPLHDVAGARIHSASWGSSSSSYTSDARQFDDFVHRNPEHLVVIAAGNSGSFGAGSVGSPATLKNGLAVGASCNAGTDIDGLVSFSSRGPTFDGRIKPDIVAPGVYTVSASAGSSCSVTTKSGTSMATPATSGAAALVRQYLMDARAPGYGAFVPSAAMLKAILITSAVSLSVRYPSSSYCSGSTEDVEWGADAAPDQNQGFGRIRLNSVLPAVEKGIENFTNFTTLLFDDETIDSTGSSWDWNVTVVNASLDLRATLVWTDPPGNVASSKALVNDLDLTLTDESGLVYFPNGLLHPDRLNPAERVNIASAHLSEGQVWKISVNATMIAVGAAQKFSVVIHGGITGDRGKLKFSSPTQYPTPEPVFTTSPTMTTSPSSEAPSLSPAPDVTVRLVDGSDDYSGRVEIWYGGEWGTVCDDFFGVADGQVVCRQLGLSLDTVLYTSEVVDGTLPILADDLGCLGSELTLQQCSGRFGRSNHDCSHFEDVGVQCYNTSEPTRDPTRYPSPYPTPPTPLPTPYPTTPCILHDGGVYRSNVAGSHYRNYVYCTFTVVANYLDFSSFSTERNYDYLRVWVGASSSGTETWRFHGSLGSFSISNNGSSPLFTLRWTTDGSVTYPGWVFEVRNGTTSSPTQTNHPSTSVPTKATLCPTVTTSPTSSSRRILLLTDNRITDPSREAANVQTVINSFTIPSLLTILSSYTSGNLSTGFLDSYDVFVIPEMERNTFYPAYASVADMNALASWIDTGGVLILFGDSNGRHLSTSLFFTGASEATCSSSGSVSRINSTTEGTPFEWEGPASLSYANAVYPSTTTGLCYYGTSSCCWVAGHAKNQGHIFFIAYDYYLSPVTSWDKVFEIAVEGFAAPTSSPTASRSPTTSSLSPTTADPISRSPTNVPTTTHPSRDPTTYPTSCPSMYPTPYPLHTAYPTPNPSPFPTAYPTPDPIRDPNTYPTRCPGMYPTPHPSPYPTPYPIPVILNTSSPTTTPIVSPTPRPPSSIGALLTTTFDGSYDGLVGDAQYHAFFIEGMEKSLLEMAGVSRATVESILPGSVVVTSRISFLNRASADTFFVEWPTARRRLNGVVDRYGMTQSHTLISDDWAFDTRYSPPTPQSPAHSPTPQSPAHSNDRDEDKYYPGFIAFAVSTAVLGFFFLVWFFIK